MIPVGDRRDAWVGPNVLTCDDYDASLAGMAPIPRERNGALSECKQECAQNFLTGPTLSETRYYDSDLDNHLLAPAQDIRPTKLPATVIIHRLPIHSRINKSHENNLEEIVKSICALFLVLLLFVSVSSL